MEIQKTTVSELQGGQARVYMQISDKIDPEPSDQHVVFSVLVSTEAKPPIHDPIAFRLLQIRALKEAIALLGQAEDAGQQQQS